MEKIQDDISLEYHQDMEAFRLKIWISRFIYPNVDPLTQAGKV